MSSRQTARRAADHLGNVQKSPNIIGELSDVERDWLAILRDRLYELANRGTIDR